MKLTIRNYIIKINRNDLVFFIEDGEGFYLFFWKEPDTIKALIDIIIGIKPLAFYNKYQNNLIG